MIRLISVITFLLTCFFCYSQNTVTGAFKGLANTQIKLIGFNGFNIYTIDSTKTNAEGTFTLSYNKSDIGMGYLFSEDEKSFVIVLSGMPLKLEGKNLELSESIKVIKGKENKWFEQYALEHARREQTLSAWDYLTKIYNKDSLFRVHKAPKQGIASEKQRIKVEDSLFLANLPKETYVSYYLPLRKLISSASTIAQYRTKEIPATIKAFRSIDYTDNRIYKSGMLKEVLESHFWLIENSGLAMDAMYIEMNISIDALVNNLLLNDKKLNDVTENLFKLLEKRSLFKASEYLALKLLNEKSCTINSDFASQLESYRSMKIGNTAPDIEFNDAIFSPAYKSSPKKLSDLKADYTVVVFGASWCPKCPPELSQISNLYTKWKAQNVEVVFVSLDTEAAQFKNFVKHFPFISVCDYKKWVSKAVKDYYVFASPTIYLLNNKQEIVLRPNDVKQLDAWIDWYLVQGNK